MNKQKVTSVTLGCVFVLLVSLCGYLIHQRMIVPQVITLYVTEVALDSSGFDSVTIVSSYVGYHSFAGIHTNIIVGHTYRIVYVTGMPFSHIISIEEIG